MIIVCRRQRGGIHGGRCVLDAFFSLFVLVWTAIRTGRTLLAIVVRDKTIADRHFIVGLFRHIVVDVRRFHFDAFPFDIVTVEIRIARFFID